MASEAFPRERIIVALEKWWQVEKVEAAELAQSAPPPKRPVSVLTPIVEIDSHRAVRALLEIEPIIGVEIPPRIVKLGGYGSFSEMADHLLHELQKIVEKKREVAHGE